jgi:FkbM family methyltransferase
MEELLKIINNIRGIIQVGANSGQEIPLFKKYTNKIILFEPLKSLCDELRENHKDVVVFDCALGSIESEEDFYVASNNGESSSLLQPLNHTVFYPSIKFLDPIKVEVKRFDSIAKEANIKVNEYNVLITDTQGYDVEVLKGFGDYIINFDLIISEYINSTLYRNDGKLDDMVTHLASYGFKLKDTCDETLGSGNAIFLKQ